MRIEDYEVRHNHAPPESELVKDSFFELKLTFSVKNDVFDEVKALFSDKSEIGIKLESIPDGGSSIIALDLVVGRGDFSGLKELRHIYGKIQEILEKNGGRVIRESSSFPEEPKDL